MTFDLGLRQKTIHPDLHNLQPSGAENFEELFLHLLLALQHHHREIHPENGHNSSHLHLIWQDHIRRNQSGEESTCLSPNMAKRLDLLLAKSPNDCLAVVNNASIINNVVGICRRFIVLA